MTRGADVGAAIAIAIGTEVGAVGAAVTATEIECGMQRQ
jgi:hypothetical protein